MATTENSKAVTIDPMKVGGILSDINMAAAATHHLSITMSADPLEAQWNHVAIANTAMVICRKADVLAAMLGEPAFGNFEEEFDVAAAREEASQ